MIRNVDPIFNKQHMRPVFSLREKVIAVRIEANETVPFGLQDVVNLRGRYIARFAARGHQNTY